MLPNHDSFDFEVDTDCSEVGSHEIAIAEFEKHVCFTHSAVANDEKFDVVVVVLISLHFFIIYKTEEFIS